MGNTQNDAMRVTPELVRINWWEHVRRAAGHAHEAASHVAAAYSTGYSPEGSAIDSPAPLDMPALDGLDERELQDMLHGYRDEAFRIGRTPEQRHADADALRPLGCEAARIADQLDGTADALAARRDSLNRAAAAVEKRIPQAIAEREAADAERAAVDANLVGIVKELRAEIADLKAKA